MIVTDGPNCYRTITQADHAEISGKIAEHWGNNKFDIPAPRHSMIIAAYNHDVGWREHDIKPRVHKGEPENFPHCPLDDWEKFYRLGIEKVSDVDPYAGLMVSMHATGLYRNRYGLYPERSPDREIDSFVKEQDKFQLELLDKSQNMSTTGQQVSQKDKPFLSKLQERGNVIEVTLPTPRVWFNYNLLEIFDFLSLYFCLNHNLIKETIENVPRKFGSETVSLDLRPIDDSQVKINPYPFDTSPLEVTLTCRMLPKKEYEDSITLIRDYYEVGSQSFTFEFIR